MKLCILMGSVLLTGCPSHQPANVRHVSLGVFEIIDCKSSSTAPITLEGEKYCLSAKPMVDETDVRLAQASRDDSGKPRLALAFTLKTGQRLRQTTERIYAEHLRRNDRGKLGIVIDGKLISAPTLSEPFSDSIMINGAFSWEDTVQIAESLNAMPPVQSPSSTGQK